MHTYLLIFLLLLAAPAFAQNANVAVDADHVPELAKTTLRARVFYEDTGRPVKRTSVMLLSNGRGGREMTGITDGNGNLEIKNLGAGKYYAIVNAPGVVTPMAYLDFRRERPDAVEEQLAGFPAIVANGISDLNIQIPARRGGAISGRIMYGDGDPAIGVKVEILRKVGDEFSAPMPNMSVITSMFTGGAGMFQTDDRGVYRFAGLPAGEYIVKATENVSHAKSSRADFDSGFEALLFGTGSMVNVFFENAFEKSKAQTLIVEFGQELSEINITLPDRGLYSLEGKVVAAKDKLPIRNARISIKRDGEDGAEAMAIYGRGQQTAQTDENGNWKFAELPKGTYLLSVEAESSEFDEKERAYGTSSDHGASAANRAVANAMAAANTAIMAAGESGYSVRRPEKPPAPKFAKKVQEFTIDDKDLPDQIIQMSYGATLIGSVSLDGDKRHEGAVTISASTENGGASSSTTVSFYSYSDESTPGPKKKDFRLEAVSAGTTYIAIIANDKDYYVKGAASNQVDLLKGPIELKEGDTLANIQVVLSKETGTLKGTVVDAETKQPVPGFEISLVPTDPAKMRASSYYRSTRSDENGEFEVKLPPFEYALVSFPYGVERKKKDAFYNWLASAVKLAQTFMIETGKTTKATIKLDSSKPSE